MIQDKAQTADNGRSLVKGRQTPHQNMNEQSWKITTRQMLLDHFGLDCSLDRLPGENRNYLVRTKSNRKFVVKVIAGEDAAAGIELENRLLEHALLHGFSAQLPCLIRDKNELLYVRIEVPGEGVYHAQLMGFVEGVPWQDTAEISDDLRFSLGRTMAQFDKAMEGFDDPRLHRGHQWDISRADQHEDAIKWIGNPQVRACVEWGLSRWKDEARPNFSALPHQIIHGDANDENIMVQGQEVTGLVDFLDCCYNPTVCELAICLSYAMMGHDEPLNVAGAVIAGYESVRPLSDLEREVLMPLICGRLAMTLCIIAKRRQTNPDHPTWYSSEARAAVLIQQLRASR